MQHDPENAEPGLVHPEVAAALGRLAELAHTRQPDEVVLPEFLERYYRELPEADLDDRRLDALVLRRGRPLRHRRQRRPGETLVRVVSPDTGLDESRAAPVAPVRRHRRRAVSSSTPRAWSSNGTVSTSI